MSEEKKKIDPEKLRIIQERNRERGLILKELKDKGPSTLDMISEATGIEKEKLFKHIVALRQLGKIAFVEKKEDEFLYGLPEVAIE
jgi:transcription initiation factor IIE alpha subunit